MQEEGAVTSQQEPFGALVGRTTQQADEQDHRLSTGLVRLARAVAPCGCRDNDYHQGA